MTLKKVIHFSAAAIILLSSCKESATRETGQLNAEVLNKADTTHDTTAVIKEHMKPYDVLSYSFEKPSDWLNKHKKDSHMLNVVTAINRTDAKYLGRLDSMLVPNDFSYELPDYLPFPVAVPALEAINKIVIFSYPAQVFAAYENGKLIYTGPVSMGRKSRPTPTGLYFANWKAEHTVSTVNDAWDLYWNFNIANMRGIGWHQYSLPGYPASHSCLRLREQDAQALYNWADQWSLKNSETIRLQGTPVIVFGKYDFDARKPWLSLAENNRSLSIGEEQLKKIIDPYLAEIMLEQKKRVADQKEEDDVVSQ